jgi:hypothetical protein
VHTASQFPGNAAKSGNVLTFKTRLSGMALWHLRSFFFLLLGFELRAYTLSHSTSPIFVMGFFEIGSRELFAQVGFEP